MVDYFDIEKKYSSMAKTTSFPASIVAQMIASNKITKRGVIFPEEVLHGDLFPAFIAALKKRGVVITHKVISH
jgi:lysine 6-dehydrogenase